MTQPAPELRAQPIGGATTEVPIAGAPERDLFYLRSPVTGDVRAVTQEQAAELISRSGWEPVIEPAAERLLARQLMREGVSPWTSAAYGATRGLTGGLNEFLAPQGDEPGAEGLQAVRDAHPGVALGSEIAGGVLPFLLPGGAAKAFTFPGLAEAGGAAVTRQLAGASPGVARSIAARAAGMAFEGGAAGSVYNAGESAIEDTPLTAQKLVSGFLMGAAPGAVIGAPVGAVEGLLGRYALKGGLLREHLVRPGVDDADLMQIAQREHGVAVPGLSDELRANMMGVSPELVKLSNDPGQMGQQVRDELVRAPELRKVAEGRAAEALNAIRDIDEVAISGVAGRMKAEQVRKWIPAGGGEVMLPDAELAVLDALRVDAPETVARQAAATVAPGSEQDLLGQAATVIPGVSPPAGAKPDFPGFASAHPQNAELLAFLNQERRAASRYERQRTAGLGGLGIENTRAGEIRKIASTLHGAQRALDDAVQAGHGKQGVFYRGERMPADAFAALSPGGEFKNPNIWSMAQTGEHAESFARKKLQSGQVPVLFEVETPAAIFADEIPGSETFEEYLLPRARKMRVASIEERDGLKVVRLSDAPGPREPTPGQPVMTPELNAMRANYARATSRFERQDLEQAALEQFGEDAARFVRGEKPSPLNIPKRDAPQARGAVSTVQRPDGSDAMPDINSVNARSARAMRMADVLLKWADESPAAAGALRNGLAAGPSQASLRKALRRGLANADEGFMNVFRAAHEAAGDEGQAALGRRLLNLGHAPRAMGPQSWKGHALDLVDELGQEADLLASQAKGVVGKKASGASEIRALLADANAKILGGDKAQAFIELDYLKKRLAKYAAPGEYLGPDQNVAAMARRHYEDVRATLENPRLWGEKAALAQKDINRIFTQRINRANVFFDKFYVDSGKAHPVNPWIRQREATQESVRKGLDGIIDPNQSREFQAIKQHIAESRDVVANLKAHYALSGDDASKLGQWSKSIDDAERAFTEASHYAQREAQASKLFNNNAKLVPGWGKWVAMHFLGPAGFLAAAAAERASNPGAGIYARAVLERTLRHSESRIARAVTKILTGKTLRLQGVGATQNIAKLSVSLLNEKPEKKKEVYAATLKELAMMVPPAEGTKLAIKAFPFARTLPRFPEHLGSQMSQASQYLLSHAPQKPRWTPYGMTIAQPSDTELHEFEARMRGAFDPLTVFEDAANGESVPMAQVEAAEFVAPEMMDHVRLLVLDEMSNGGHKLSYQKTLVLSRVLGIDLDRTLEPEYINAQQMVYAARNKSMPNPSDNRSTGQESGVNKEYRMSHDQKIDAGVPPS